MRIDLVKREVTNDGTTDILLVEYIEKTSTIAPGATIVLNPETKTIKI